MNEKITLPALIQLLSIASGDTRKQSEDFLREFFGVVSDTLSRGEQVRIKGLGIFKTLTVEERKSVNVANGSEQIIPAHKKVVFVPSKELSLLVNEPFEMFETVELSNEELLKDESEGLDANEEDASEEDTSQEDGNEEDGNEEDGNEEDGNEEDGNEEDGNEEESNGIAAVGEDQISFEEDSDTKDPDDSDKLPDTTSPEYEVSDLEEHHDVQGAHHHADNEMPSRILKDDVNEVISDEPVNEDLISTPIVRKSRFWPGFLIGFCSAAVIAGIAVLVIFYFGLIPAYESEHTADKDNSGVIASSVTNENTGTAANVVDTLAENRENAPMTADSESKVKGEPESEVRAEDAESVPTRPSDEKIYDTISQTRYLTTMAKQYYGNFNLWPYIYMENQAFLGHPDRIKPGTKVVIPPLSKFGVDPKNPADIAEAKKLGVEIYSRYKK